VLVHIVDIFFSLSKKSLVIKAFYILSTENVDKSADLWISFILLVFSLTVLWITIVRRFFTK